MRYVSGTFVLETWGEVEKLYDLGDTSFLMNVRRVRDLYICLCVHTHTHTHTCIFKVSALLKLPIQSALK